jgi:hypothetical protein
MPFKYRIYTGDLGLVIDCWKKKASDIYPGAYPECACADIDHKDSGMPFRYRVYTTDLGVVIDKWKYKDTALPGDCPRNE